jgi:hypothetical protein
MPDFDLAKLEGEHCRIFPYTRGYYPRDILYHAWKIMEDDQEAARVFHGYLGYDDRTPIPHRGDLAQFCQYFEASTGRLLVLCQSKADGRLAGFVWGDDVIPEFRALVNIFFAKPYRGIVALEGGHLALRYAFDALKLQYLWGFTPWPAAKRYCQRLGFKSIGVLPAFNRIDGEARDMHVLRLRAEDYLLKE